MSNWTPRYTAPQPFDPYYTSTQQDPTDPDSVYPAYNPYPDVSANGFVLPNCTGLAAGRQLEQGYGAEISPANGFGNANTWYSAAANFYERGQEPRTGAIAVWDGGSHIPPAGHVATVERYDPDTDTIYTSNSNYGGTVFYMLTQTGHNPSMGASYTFLGYIYPAGNPTPFNPWLMSLLTVKRKNYKYVKSKRKRRAL